MVTKSDTDLDMDSETIHLVNTVRYGYLIKIADSGGAPPVVSTIYKFLLLQ